MEAARFVLSDAAALLGGHPRWSRRRRAKPREVRTVVGRPMTIEG